MFNIGFNRIDNEPDFPAGMPLPTSKMNWESKAKVVRNFKTSLKLQLRNKQKGRCCFCRRLLGDDGDVHIEHYLEKSALPELTFEIKNLALSCSTCNNAKAGAYKRLCGRLRKQKFRKEGIKSTITRCIGFSGAFLPELHQNQFRLVHPYFHCFDDHLAIKKGWIYVSKSRIGYRTRKCLKFNDISAIEARAKSELLAAHTGPASLVIEIAYADADEQLNLARNLVKYLEALKTIK